MHREKILYDSQKHIHVHVRTYTHASIPIIATAMGNFRTMIFYPFASQLFPEFPLLNLLNVKNTSIS